MKITHPNYFLPLIEAQLGIEVLNSGTTQPHLIKGVCHQTGERYEYVVKYRNANRMTVEACCRELIGAWIGHELDMNVVEPVLVNVSANYAETLIGRDGFRNANNSLGLNFGCKYVQGYIELVRNQPLNNSQEDRAKQIFALDMFISNPDRRIEKPNFLTNGKDILIFDHELAFDFLMILPFFRNETPWIFRIQEREWFENHYFFPYLRKQKIDFSEFAEKLLLLDNYFWQRVKQFIPDNWLSNQIDEIQTYLDGIIKHREEFSNQLTQILLQ